MAERKLYVDRIPLGQYTELERRRIKSDALQEGIFYSIMMRDTTKPKEAFAAPVVLQDLRRDLGYLAANVYFADKDLRLLNHPLYSEVRDRDFWVPSRALPLRSPNIRVDVNTGYFAPYIDDIDKDILKMFEELQVKA